jgi:hypothetical protein
MPARQLAQGLHMEHGGGAAATAHCKPAWARGHEGQQGLRIAAGIAWVGDVALACWIVALLTNLAVRREQPGKRRAAQKYIANKLNHNQL